MGVYEAWELYVSRLAHCLNEACRIRSYMETCAPEQAGDEVGRLMCEIFTINSFVLGPMPVSEFNSGGR